MTKKLKVFFLEQPAGMWWVYAVAVVVATAQQYFGGTMHMTDAPYSYTQYNNYVIFRQSFHHLVDGLNLYVVYPTEQWDLYKYSPTFALVFGVFAALPDSLGLLFWNALNAAMLIVGVRSLKWDSVKKNLVLLIAVAEMLTSIQNSQSNALIAGLVVLAFACLERRQFFLACLLIALTVYVKLFGVVVFALCLLYPERWRMVGYALFWMVILALLPLPILGWTGLLNSYRDWWVLLQQDFVPNSLSLIGALQAWFHVTISKEWMLLAGIVFFAMPFAFFQRYSDSRFRAMILAMILIWVVIFNHKAESPTFIIAMAGMALWYFTSSLSRTVRIVVIVSAVVLTSLSTTDLFPEFIQEGFFEPFSIKALMPIVIYFLGWWEIVFRPAQAEMIAE